MLGQPMSMVLPEVIGYRLTGQLPSQATGTDLVLTITKVGLSFFSDREIILCLFQKLREVGVVGKFVEFFGPGCASLSIADRATISNMSPEQGTTAAFFPADHNTMAYLAQTGNELFCRP